MTNDITTLNGALTELGENMASNLISMGVTGVSASDGLTTLCGKILDIAPSVGGLPLTTSITINHYPNTIATGGTLLLEATVHADYDDTSQANIDLNGYLQGATVTFKDGNTVLGTSITDTNGVATYTINNLTVGTHTFSALFNGTGTDYGSTTKSITLTVSTTIIDDKCTAASGLSNYGSSVPFEGNSTNTLTFNTDEYVLGGNGNYFSGVEILPLSGISNAKVRIKFKLNTTSYGAYNQLGIMCTDAEPSSTKISRPYCCRVRNDGNAQYFDLNSEYTFYTRSNFSNDWYYLECIKDGVMWTISIYDSNLTLLSTYTTYLSPMTGTPKWYMFLLTERGGGYSVHLKEIRAEPLTDKTTFSDTTMASSHLPLYESISIHNSSGQETVSWDNTENAYKCSNANSGFSLIKFNNKINSNYFKASADIKLTGTGWQDNGMLGFAESTNPNTGYCVGGWVQGQQYFRMVEFNGSNEVQTTTNETWNGISTSDYNHHELKYIDGHVTYTITNPDGVTSKTITMDVQGTDYVDGYIGLFVESTGSNNCWFKNVTVKLISSLELSFANDNIYYTQDDNNITLTLLLEEFGEPLANETITVIDSQNHEYTPTTNNNGIATITVPTQDLTYTATYLDVTTTCSTQEVTMVEYLQATGSQYINTGYILKSSDIVDVTFSSQGSINYEAVFGARKSSYSTNAYDLFSRFNRANKIVYNRTGQEKQGNSITTNTIYEVHTEGSTCTVKQNGTVVDTITSSGTINDCINPCGLFTLNTDSGTGFTKDTFSNMKIYNFKITDNNNNVIMELIPVRINSTGYMYDKVSQTLMTNTGTFQYGNDI